MGQEFPQWVLLTDLLFRAGAGFSSEDMSMIRVNQTRVSLVSNMGGTVSIERQQIYVLHLSPVGRGKCANNYYFSQLVEEGDYHYLATILDQKYFIFFSS